MRVAYRWGAFAGCVVLALGVSVELGRRTVERVPPLPGADPLPTLLRLKIARTMTEGTHRFTNRLALETSPYLLQHAHNPVDWHPWGEEAFEQAKKEGKPILLSIGYSTCHWCHVMEKESFEDLEIAEFLNRHYIPIKVDREERPDVDAIYMAAVQLMTGGGGWPMTVWLTPDRQPFYAGTYFPARDGNRGARMGFLTLLGKLEELYRGEGERVAEQARQLTTALSDHLRMEAGKNLPGPAAFHAAYEWFERNHDERFGGFGGAPKFPRPAALDFLLRYARRSGSGKGADMVLNTLRRMAWGGMYDQIGGGFHRYSTDAHWLVPHFEKMLYDNAQLALTYVDAFQWSGEAEFAQTARETLDYLSREMSDREGGFWSATDADSEGVEGKFFVWKESEILEVLGRAEGELFAEYYGVTQEGNFEGENVLFVEVPPAEFARKKKISREELEARLAKSREKLYEHRKKRVPPHTDDKVLAAWNGLAIAAFARAGLVLGQAGYLERAKRAADFVLTRMRREGMLLRSYRAGKAKIPGYLDDYAFLAFGLLELFEATQEIRWLEAGRTLVDEMLRRFWDEKEGGFFMAGPDHETLLAREKPYYDGAEPSGNAVAALVLFRLESFTADAEYGKKGEATLRAFSKVTDSAPFMVPALLSAAEYRNDEAKEILLVGERAQIEPFLAELRKLYLPNRILVASTSEPPEPDLVSMIPMLRGKTAQGGKGTAYVCVRQTCELPATDVGTFSQQVRNVVGLEIPK